MHTHPLQTRLLASRQFQKSVPRSDNSPERQSQGEQESTQESADSCVDSCSPCEVDEEGAKSILRRAALPAAPP